MPFTTPDLSDAYPDTQALAPILKNLGGKKTFWGKIETLQCPDDNSFVKELLNSQGKGKISQSGPGEQKHHYQVISYLHHMHTYTHVTHITYTHHIHSDTHTSHTHM